jgi:hypothetical protein
VHEALTVPKGMSAELFTAKPPGESGSQGWPAATSLAPLAPGTIEGAKRELGREPSTARPGVIEESGQLIGRGFTWLNRSLEDPKWRVRFGIGAAVLVALFVLRAVIAGRSAATDQELRRIYETGDYQATEKFFVDHMGGFKYASTAFELASDARARRVGIAPLAHSEAEAAEATPDAPAAAPEGEGTAEAATEAAPEPAPAAAQAQPGKKDPELSVPSEAPEPAHMNKAQKTMYKRAASAYRVAAELMAGGDRGSRPERALESCLEAMELPVCHLRAAVLYERRNQTAEALRHFKRYLLQEPNAPQAAAIRQKITNAER